MRLTPGIPAATLFPDGQAAFVLSVSNVHIGSLALDGSQGTGGFGVDGGRSGCAVAALTYTTQSNGGVGWTVPAKVGATNGTLAIALANSLAMSVGAVNACHKERA